MKRKFANRPDWKRIYQKRYALMEKQDSQFAGIVTIFAIDEVREPLVMGCCNVSVCVADAGYVWLQHFPEHSHFTLTTMFNQAGEIVQHYIDIVKEHGVTNEGIPWFDDLYLDVVKLPTGELEIIDGDELDEALQKGVITQADHDLAWQEANRIKGLIEQDQFPLFSLCVPHYQGLLGKV
ncbi:UNVERIFIED_CONTAM: putative RNA-binding protein associated with RNAse of E/G family [Brevibacillus sp. OAP136]